MPAAYSWDLRERVGDAIEEGVSRRGAASRFRISASTAIRWARRLAETGTCAARATGGDFRSKAIEVHRDWLLALVAAEPDLSLGEIRTRLRDTHGLCKSLSCLSRFYVRHDISFKKKRARRRTGSR